MRVIPLKALLRLRADEQHSEKALGAPVLPQDTTEVLKLKPK